MSKPNPVVHFEVGYFDRERAKKFYSQVFGWKMQQMGPEMGEYVVAQTTETDDQGMVKTPGKINGGFYQKIENPLSHAPSIVIQVDDIREAMRDVEAHGGKILGAMQPDDSPSMEPMEIPGVGQWISCMDTEQNRFSIIEPPKH